MSSMNSAMAARPALSGDEWNLILELLQQERSDLAPEIHHTDTAEEKDRLHRRLALVNGLLAKLAQ
jgi:uncharacterized alpha-E superfamily protein